MSSGTHDNEGGFQDDLSWLQELEIAGQNVGVYFVTDDPVIKYSLFDSLIESDFFVL